MNEITRVLDAYGLKMKLFTEPCSLETLYSRCTSYGETDLPPSKQKLLDAAMMFFLSRVSHFSLSDMKKFQQAFGLSEEWNDLSPNLSQLFVFVSPVQKTPRRLGFSFHFLRNVLELPNYEPLLEDFNTSYKIKKMFSTDPELKSIAIDEIIVDLQPFAKEFEQVDLNPFKTDLLNLFLQHHQQIWNEVTDIVKN